MYIFINCHGVTVKNFAVNAVFPKYLIDYQNVKIVKSEYTSEKSKKNKLKNKVVFKKWDKKALNRHDVTWPSLLILCAYL